MNVETQIRLDKFKLRDYQRPIAQAIATEGGKYRKLFVVMPRRAGKDILCWNLMIRAALRKVGIYFYCLPTFSQARGVIWDSITNTGERFIDYIPAELIAKTNQQEMKITLINGSIISLIGSDTYDTSIIGKNPCMIVFSEYALADENAYKIAALPILRANDGVVVIISTPRGKNHMYELYQIAMHSPDWFCYKLTLDETQHISAEEIKKEIASGEISEDLAAQEYWCFPPGQSVLLHDSVKKISEVKVGDLVIAHTGRPRRVMNVFERKYKGALIEIGSFGSSELIRCTPEHPLRIYNPHSQEYDWKPANEITLDDLLVFPKINFTSLLPIVSQDFCMLSAWYITEGSCCNNAVQFTLGKEQEVERVCFLLDSLDMPYAVRRSGGIINVTVNSTALVDFFKTHFGTVANNKKIDFGLISSYESDFFFELIKGDGCFFESAKELKISFTTVSQTLAYQFQLLGNSLNHGYAIGITERAPYIGIIQGREVNCQKSYQLNISLPKTGRKARSNYLMRAKNCVAAKIKSITTTNFEGNVYNLEVQYDESYLVAGRATHNCSFDKGQEGSYYAKYLDRMRLKGQIGVVAWEPYHKVHTTWDLGIKDPTCIIFFQVIGQTVRIIDYYEQSDRGMDHFANVILGKPYVYGKHFPPHDIMARESARGLSKRDLYKELGILFSDPVSVDIEDGIELVRRMLPKVWIDEKNCKQLIKALENYREEWDDRRKVYKGRPLHDWSSHAADAMRYLACALPRVTQNTDPIELDKRYREAMFGGTEPLPNFFRDQQPY